MLKKKVRVLSNSATQLSKCLFLFLKILKFFIFIQFLKVTFHLQLLQNIGYISRVVQYILEPIVHPVVCTSHLPIPILPLPLPHL